MLSSLSIMSASDARFSFRWIILHLSREASSYFFCARFCASVVILSLLTLHPDPETTGTRSHLYTPNYTARRTQVHHHNCQNLRIRKLLNLPAYKYCTYFPLFLPGLAARLGLLLKNLNIWIKSAYCCCISKPCLPVNH